MARNVEIKARLQNYQAQLELARALSGQVGEPIHQIDVFFACERGRLKLRCFDDGSGELIFYRREDRAGPKLSDYVRSPVEDPGSLREALTRAYGAAAIVEKDRLLLITGQTRIHLDRVRDLGDFLELEVVLEEDQTLADGQAEAERLMEALNIDPAALIEKAYVDLMS